MVSQNMCLSTEFDSFETRPFFMKKIFTDLFDHDIVSTGKTEAVTMVLEIKKYLISACFKTTRLVIPGLTRDPHSYTDMRGLRVKPAMTKMKHALISTENTEAVTMILITSRYLNIIHKQ